MIPHKQIIDIRKMHINESSVDQYHRFLYDSIIKKRRRKERGFKSVWTVHSKNQKREKYDTSGPCEYNRGH